MATKAHFRKSQISIAQIQKKYSQSDVWLIWTMVPDARAYVRVYLQADPNRIRPDLN